ncbi:hypothetical protein BaRGS_00017333 [Batillaria attramentaria]|uniref:Uncharacterized protein n=1 Tax=Batillaria attramentaria TaxID=370345 RepID=A0ABD0KW96_9CAEN
MEVDLSDNIKKDDIIFYSVLYSSVTVVFGMAVLSKFLTNEFRFGFRSFLSLILLFLGEPLCQFFVEGPGGFAIFAVGCLLVYSILPASHLPADKKSVLITGCDSGFGYALVQKLDSIGMRVFAGFLDVDGLGAMELRDKCSRRLVCMQLDVTKRKDIDAAVAAVQEAVGEEGLWGLVNNAGVWYFSELEMTSEKVMRRVMDVNLFGAVNITKSLLPLVRQAKGRIVNVSSLLGRMTMEGTGAYSMSKHALVAYTDTLRQEMTKWGVHVAIIEPAAFRTGNTQEQVLRQRQEEIWNSLDPETQETYGYEYLNAIYSHVLTASSSFPSDLTPAVRCMRSALLSMRPRARYPCGTGAEFIICSYPLLPVWIADRLMASIGLLPRHRQLRT